MSKKDDVIEIKDAIVLEKVFAKTYNVQLPNGVVVKACQSGRMSLNKINVLPGDFVNVEFSTYDLSQGRIVYRRKRKGENNES